MENSAGYLISREAAVKLLRDKANSYFVSMFATSGDCHVARVVATEAASEIANMPAVDAVPVVHGRLVYRDGYNTPVCSECGCVFKDIEWLFCPNCGAKMDKE